MSGVLDIVALRSLTAIADSGGFRRAAGVLHLSQSAVSQHVRRLELVCGRPLVQRFAGGIRFTPDGEVLLREARIILAAHDHALAQLRLLDAAAPALTIGSTEHAAELLLPAISATLRERFPETAVGFRIDRGPQLQRRLDAGALDVSLFLGAAPGGPIGRTEVAPAGRLPLAWYAAPGWEPDRRPGDRLAVVAIDEPCTIRRRGLKALAEKGIPASVVCEAGHLSGVLNAARAGLGVALLAHLGPPPEGLEKRNDLPAIDPEPLHVRGRAGAATGLVSSVALAVAGRIAERSSQPW